MRDYIVNLFGSIFFVFKSNRILALVVLLVMLSVYGVLAFGWKNEK